MQLFVIDREMNQCVAFHLHEVETVTQRDEHYCDLTMVGGRKLGPVRMAYEVLAAALEAEWNKGRSAA